MKLKIEKESECNKCKKKGKFYGGAYVCATCKYTVHNKCTNPHEQTKYKI